ncbi:MAG: [FeFe] hydrogenase H-cluster radical SAM maturase HydE [Spirochaetales bacterium]|nr:[FeFe] hydrogenase H-cluster radical SAM maturase HydE [Spirochaetales bacterium]
MNAPPTGLATSTCNGRVPQTPEVTHLASWLRGEAPGGDAALASRARSVMREEVGSEVRLRGLLEFSNRCRCDCHYCGIRKGTAVRRFDLDEEEIAAAARFCLEQGHGSMTLQSGERRDEAFIRFVERCLRRIKVETRTAELPDGLGVTLCVGEQRRETYERFFEAGAHRYLLRIETSNPDLFGRLHPAEQRWEERVRALRDLKEIGYQVGTGVMIGIPGQTYEDLARDVLFFREIDADMIGMGPYIASPPPGDGEMRVRGLFPTLSAADRLRLSLRMIASTRIVLRDVNIAATTALQALSPTGREIGLAFGANVLMPIVTPGGNRSDYQLYAGKPCIDEDSSACAACTPRRAAAAMRPVSLNSWGDAPHAVRREADGTPECGESAAVEHRTDRR